MVAAEPGRAAGAFDISATEEWAALRRHTEELRSSHLRDLFDADPGRADRFTTTVGDLAVDWSRQIVTDRTVELLLALAERAGVAERIAATLAGEPVNATEGRAALHTALRAGRGAVGTSSEAASEAAAVGVAANGGLRPGGALR